MKIVVLAAGEGKRMWPIQTDKCLIPFLGKPLLYYNLKQIQKAFVQMSPDRGTNVLIIASPQIQERVAEIARSLNLDCQIAVQKEPKGMADAILSAKELVNGEILVVNAEDILDYQSIQGSLGGQGEVIVTGLQVKKYFPGGYLQVTGDPSASLRTGRLQGIVEKPGEGNESSDLIKLVVDYFKDGKKLVEYLEKVSDPERTYGERSRTSRRDDQYEVALDQMIKDGMDVRFSKYDGTWIPLKYPWHILDITAHFLSQVEQQISPEAKVSDKAIIEGNVVIEEGVKVFEGAIVKGPCYIGKNCIVGNNSMIRESDLEEGCVTGFNSDITRSYIGANSWFHTNYVGDSVLEGDIGMGSGAVLANLRLDNKTVLVGENRLDTGRHKLGLVVGIGVRMGVNASTMPGVRVGAGSLIGPGVVLKKDLPENKKIVLKEESFEVKEYQASATNYDQFRDKLK